jgi:hypothetical protein
MSKIDHRTKLAELGEQREKAQRELATIETSLRKAVLAADRAKAMPRREIAEVARISPQSVYNWLGEQVGSASA